MDMVDYSLDHSGCTFNAFNASLESYVVILILIKAGSSWNCLASVTALPADTYSMLMWPASYTQIALEQGSDRLITVHSSTGMQVTCM
jgi:hypothetical protein